jgi:transposase
VGTAIAGKPANGVTPDSESKPANEVTPDFVRLIAEKQAIQLPASTTSTSLCEPFRETIEMDLGRGRNGKAIWQDLVSVHGFTGDYQSVKRFVRKLRGSHEPQPVGIIITEPGQEAQVDYGTGPMVRYPQTGKYRRTRLFVLTLGYSRKSVRLLTFGSS